MTKLFINNNLIIEEDINEIRWHHIFKNLARHSLKSFCKINDKYKFAIIFISKGSEIDLN
jgi:hypothetical protein